MIGDLSRAFSGRETLTTRRTWLRGVAFALCSVLSAAAPLRAADNLSGGGASAASPAQLRMAEMRRITGCLATPTDDIQDEVAIRGRHSIMIKGRERGGDAADPLRDLAVFDQAAGRIVSYVCFPNASTRKSGEGIVSLAEISSGADKLARAFFPGSNLELESVSRHRADGSESIYYTAHYSARSGESPFLEPPVSMLLNASTGGLFRLDIDPDWLDPPAPPRARISRKAAEQIATVFLKDRDLAAAFGPAAVFKAVSAAELLTVHPNDWLGFFTESAEARARVAWVVPFRVAGAEAGIHSLFVDAATGAILGGLPGRPLAQPSR